ncbi:uncharacterized protein LOC130428843 isoform X1 [Triplophysa dalaica]|uniref:uncharacterized protein LOC130428843 isoform X1 n=1 Tax=Triplophysa dalaica TaxID=1582913 RepID=UPI0024DF5753|nr:uncharacterized protein LOC130428843 isoform X1 [Triplophysa dalaica]
MNLLLCLIFEGFLLYETFAWGVRMPHEIHGLKGSCLVIPCSFYYTSYPPNRPDRVVWYQWVSKGYPLVYDPWYPSYVIDKFREKTYLYGNPTNRECSLLIKRLDQSHHGEKLYAWIDPETVGKSTYRFFDVTSTILVDTHPKPPTINIYGGERTGDDMTVACHTYHSCPYSKPNIILKGLEGSDQIKNDPIEGGLWKITLTRKGVVKAESSDIECIVKHYGGIPARATKNKNSACIYSKITIEPDRADVVEGVAKDFNCTINHSCLKDPPSISWNYENMQVSNRYNKLTQFISATSSTITFLADKKDKGKKLICTATFSGKNVQASVDLHVQNYETRLVDPEIKDTDRVYEADVVPRLTALPRSCVVIPCSFQMHEELAVHLWVRWVWKKGYMFHSGQSKVLDNFKGRTKLLGNSIDQDCTVEIDNVQNHDNGPFCFRGETEKNEYFFNNSCVFIVMRAPEKLVMSPIPDNIQPGTNVTIECSVKHTCPSHPPSITWSVPTARETVKHQSMGEGVWETVSTVTFIPTGYEEEDQIICNALFWGDRTVVNSSTKLSVQRFQRVGVEILGPSIIVPILVFLLLCIVYIVYKRRRRMTEGGAVWTNRGHENDIRFNNETSGIRSKPEQRSKDVFSVSANKPFSKPRLPSPNSQRKKSIKDYENYCTNMADLNIYGNIG